MSNQYEERPQDPVTENNERPCYQPPRVLLYSEEELLERLGPAKACVSSEDPWSTTSTRIKPSAEEETKWYDPKFYDSTYPK